MINKTKYYLKIIAISITTLIAFFSYIISFVGIIMYFISGFNNDILLGTIGWFIIGLILSYFVKRYHHLWDEYYKNRKIETVEIPIKFDTVFRTLLYVISFLFLYRYFQGFIGPFPEEITKDIALEILKLISQINGVLIGFLGVAIFQIYKKRELNHFAISLTFFSFIISILHCINNMTKLNMVLYTKDIIYPPITFLLSGICLFYIFILIKVTYTTDSLTLNDNKIDV